MYKISARQILVIALTSALFAAGGVMAFEQIENDFQEVSSAFSVPSPSNITEPSLASDEQNNIEFYKTIAPGVVYIQSTTTVRDFFGLFSEPVEGAGSGSIIDDQGDILTNYHVIANAEKLTVSFGAGKNYPAKVVGRDPDTDLAVIRFLESPKQQGTVWPLADPYKLIAPPLAFPTRNPSH